MESQRIPPGPAAGLHDRARENASPAGNGGNKTDLSPRMSQEDYGALSPDATDRVYPIRSVIEIDPKDADSVSSSTNGQQTSRKHGVTEETGLTSVPEQPGSGDPGWKVKQAGENTETPHITTRFTHRVTQDGHMVVTGVVRAEQMKQCEVSSTSVRIKTPKG